MQRIPKAIKESQKCKTAREVLGVEIRLPIKDTNKTMMVYLEQSPTCENQNLSVLNNRGNMKLEHCTSHQIRQMACDHKYNARLANEAEIEAAIRFSVESKAYKACIDELIKRKEITE